MFDVKNFIVRGRVFGVKKSTILLVSCLCNLLFCLTFVLLSIFLWQNYFLWFFIFCFFAGLHSLIKSLLFRLDSACYFGFLLIGVGVAGILSYSFSWPFKFFYFMLGSGAASLLTYLFTKQKFHIFLGILLLASGVISYLFCIKVLNLALFLTIFLIFLFIFASVCAILFVRYYKKPK